MLSLHGPVINLTFSNFETTFPGARVTNIWSWSTCLPMLTPDFPATFLFEYIRSSHSLLLFPFFFFYFFLSIFATRKKLVSMNQITWWLIKSWEISVFTETVSKYRWLFLIEISNIQNVETFRVENDDFIYIYIFELISNDR